MVCHKSGKEYIIPDTLSKLASTNHTRHDNLYFELYAIFTYHTILVEISSDLIKRILNDYLANN